MQSQEEDARYDTAINDDGLQWDACASHKDCDSCLNASVACHFCKSDFQCHAIGSPFGCPVGVSVCHHLEDCERSDPQYVGKKPASRHASLSAALETDKKKKKKKKKATLRDDEERAQAQRQPLLLGEIREGEVLLFENEVDQASLERLRTRYEEDERQFNWKAFASRVTWLTVTISMTVLALMFYPRMPDYNVCNREFEWESILHSILGLEPKVEYQWELDKPWEAKAGSISDVIAGINIRPGYAEGIALWKDFSKNELIFRINATITGSITWGRHKIYRISSSTPDVEFLVGAEYDRGLCKCTEYLTPT
ncbi:hypothetical protein PC119_g15118 [Phytophthora cactorum]|nr:hypothetical protein PC111_g13163 [Phytophthora cactorum]KAG3005951.1 hypothetical protein PC119_g15118 [Phytophthora cactorum]